MDSSINDHLKKLHPYVQEKFNELFNVWKSKGFIFKVTDSYRNFDTQQEFFNRGTSKVPGGLGIHNYGHAIDVYNWNGNKWDRPSDEMLKIAQKMGFESYGLSWGWDFYHIQFTSEFVNQKGGDLKFLKKYGRQLLDTYDLPSPSDKKKFIEQLTKLGAKENFIKF
ncbi:MAG: hypothetical protein EBS55_15040 [Flavobacteriaceae bacterium]|nr:hypothetical protein [Flavobacteriaceae bacterium]